ncbi:lycopene cyclase family protein [Streptomyces sp. NPDC006460]|uniref:lycopene cyclase family protein n=1 Tax=Streptomyces sp. NPDC006460 TaxID=3154304 RepID=UPI0033A124D4
MRRRANAVGRCSHGRVERVERDIRDHPRDDDVKAPDAHPAEAGPRSDAREGPAPRLTVEPVVQGEQMAPTFTDVVIVGAGAAWLSLAWRLLHPPAGIAVPGVVLVDAPAGPLRPPERTWCYWERGSGAYDDLLTASWGPSGCATPKGPGPCAAWGPSGTRCSARPTSSAVCCHDWADSPASTRWSPTSETWRRGPGHLPDTRRPTALPARTLGLRLPPSPSHTVAGGLRGLPLPQSRRP